MMTAQANTKNTSKSTIIILKQRKYETELQQLRHQPARSNSFLWNFLRLLAISTSSGVILHIRLTHSTYSRSLSYICYYVF